MDEYRSLGYVRPIRRDPKEAQSLLRQATMAPDPLDRLEHAQALCEHVAALIEAAKEEARERGDSWEKVGAALGTTKQNARQRFATKLKWWK